MRKTFKADGDFGAYDAAEDWCRENGYSVGSMQCDAPVGIAKGKGIYISKWCNLGADAKRLDGVIAAGSKRESDVTVIIFDDVDKNDVYS